MEKLAKQNLCKWHNLDEKNKKFRNLRVNSKERKIFFSNLHFFGYMKLPRKSNNILKKFSKSIPKKI